MRAWLKRIALVCASACAVSGVLWFGSPGGTHIQQRVDRLLQAEGAPLLDETAIPPMLSLAIVAIEDERFFKEPGIDPVAVARALSFDVGHGCLCQGASTITEQLVKQVYLSGTDKGLSKLTDTVVAVKVSSVLTKDQILADYLSVVPTGPGMYGVAEAACTYFGRHLDSLALPQYALLAGLVQAPYAYDPESHPDSALGRRAEVLSAMVSEGYITQEQAQAAATASLDAGGTPACADR